jgi:CheY-like chemotaxis protein
VTTVLVVDDEAFVREVVVGYLQRDGHRTLEAADGGRPRVRGGRACSPANTDGYVPP